MKIGKTKINLLLLTIVATIVFMFSSHVFGRRADDYFSDKLQAALATAAGKGNIKQIDILLKKGADINCTGKENVTALLWAMYAKNKKGFEYLLEKGADPNVLLEKGWSVMHLAALAPDIWYLETVIKHGGNVNLVDPVTHETPLITSIGTWPESLGNVKLLIKSGANINYQGENRKAAIIFAADLNQYETVYYLLEHGADPTINDKWGYTIVHCIDEAHIDEKSDGYKWMLKVIELLKTKGIEANYIGYKIYHNRNN